MVFGSYRIIKLVTWSASWSHERIQTEPYSCVVLGVCHSWRFATGHSPVIPLCAGSHQCHQVVRLTNCCNMHSCNALTNRQKWRCWQIKLLSQVLLSYITLFHKVLLKVCFSSCGTQPQWDITSYADIQRKICFSSRWATIVSWTCVSRFVRKVFLVFVFLGKLFSSGEMLS